ncbi:MAG: flagellar C-ring protein [Candidatus Liberibacter ctenarytainae]|uniref:Flagellar motor switch protein FliM n=1 Tax=Candidatus Liberibacter ctenarytainae TaxID=2020335 RepID=A0A937DLJ2_9HYPH|nr:flagellar C-ring protein [Candidatus Liberibacter ctenarytainae]
MREQPINKDIQALLIARLTGKMGDKNTIEKISSNFGQFYTKLLPETLKKDMGIGAIVSYIDCKSGKFTQIINSFKDPLIFYQTSVNGWASNFFIGCRNDLIIVCLEHLLNTDHETIQKLPDRPLSIIEQKLAKLIVTKIATILDQFVSISPSTLNPLNGPYDIDYLNQNTNQLSNKFFSAINMEIIVNYTVSPFILIVPQEILLKTTLASAPIQDQSSPIEDSPNPLPLIKYPLYVNLETRINLKQMTIKDILQLKVGQTIPFLDSDNNCVILNINGKDVYSCELGRIGKNYTVRIKDKINFIPESIGKNQIRK